MPNYTITDVARLAGVSVSTVSRILNGKQDVAEETRERVQKVIEELGYSPHAHARDLRAGKIRSIAMVFPIKYPSRIPFNPLDVDFIVGGSAAAGERGFVFNLQTASLSKTSLLELYRSAHVSGTVLMQVHVNDWRVNLLIEKNLPFVMIGHNESSNGASFVDIDFVAAIEMAFAHLVELGHRHIALLAHPHKLRAEGYGPAVRTWDGYQSVLSKYPIIRLYREVEFSGDSIYDAVNELLDEDPELTSIVTVHADAAMTIMHALHMRGRQIPKDCSVVTLTTARIAEVNRPRLTYIRFPSYEMGYNAVATLIDLLRGEVDSPQQQLIKPELIVGDSTVSV